MKRITLILLCCFALSFSCFSQGEECVSLYNSAMELYNKGDYSSALVFFKRVKSKCDEYRDVSNKIKECEDNLKEGSKAGIIVGKSRVSFDPVGGTETIKVNTENASWYFGKAPEWLKLSKSKGQLVIKCEGNDSGAERKADITLYSGEGSDKVSKRIHITQGVSILTVSSTSLSFPEHGSAIYKIRVESNDSWSISSQSDSWFNVTKTDEGVTVSCAENSYAKKREGSFCLVTSNNKSVTISITQDPSRPVFEIEETSLKFRWNEGDRKLKINTNIPDWSVEGVSTAWWCEAVKMNEQELLIKIKEYNESGHSREVEYKVCAAGMEEHITVTQRTLGYQSLYEDYFDNMGGTWRITPVTASVYGGGSWGIRMSGLKVRWKVVELDLLNLNTSYSKKSFLLSWEPMVRGYLPLQRDGLAWTPYLGVGGCVAFIDKSLIESIPEKHSGVLAEAGVEFNLKLKNDNAISSRVFIRIDGTFSVGAAFDLHKWRTKLFK